MGIKYEMRLKLSEDSKNYTKLIIFERGNSEPYAIVPLNKPIPAGVKFTDEIVFSYVDALEKVAKIRNYENITFITNEIQFFIYNIQEKFRNIFYCKLEPLMIKEDSDSNTLTKYQFGMYEYFLYPYYDYLKNISIEIKMHNDHGISICSYPFSEINIPKDVKLTYIKSLLQAMIEQIFVVKSTSCEINTITFIISTPRNRSEKLTTDILDIIYVVEYLQHRYQDLFHNGPKIESVVWVSAI